MDHKKRGRLQGLRAGLRGLFVLAFLAILLGSGLWLTGSRADSQSPYIFFREPDLSGPSSSWSSVLATLRGQVSANLEAGSGLSLIRATLNDCSAANTKPVLMNFEYVQPSGRVATVFMDDATPPQVLSIDKDSGLDKPLSEAELLRMNTEMENAKITFRQACLAAWPEGHLAAPQTFATLRYSDAKPLAWDLLFGNAPKSADYLEFQVSADTGKIIEKSSYPTDRVWLPTPQKP